MNQNNEFDEMEAEELKVSDKTKTNSNDDFTDADEIISDRATAKSPEMTALEAEYKTERERREAAERKLVEVQARFEAVKNALEKETAEMRERMRKSLEERAKQNQTDFLNRLLPVFDNLNLAITAAENEAASPGLRSGLRGTANGFEAALTSVGVEPIPAVGAAFDPELHEAVDMVEADKNGITKEYSRGYKFGERLLRPARVQVGRAAANNSAEAAAE